jgi:predicted XRE-type DNA-binding protein
MVLVRVACCIATFMAYFAAEPVPLIVRCMAETNVDALSLQVAHEVRAWMIRRDVRQETLASALGISQSAMSMRLRGRTRWTVNDLAAAASVLGVPMSVLLAPPSEGNFGEK